jgi:hypothetical protein
MNSLNEKGFKDIEKHIGHTLKLCRAQNTNDCLSKYVTVRCMDCAEMIHTIKENKET